MKPITNLAITGITKRSQMKKLAKLTNTAEMNTGLSIRFKERPVFYFGSNSKDGYWNWIGDPEENAIHMTWKQFLKKYDNPCKGELKRLKKENKALKQAAKKSWSTDDLKDKEPVWCWDTNTHNVVFRFWDKKNNCTFCHAGLRNGSTWDNYAPFKGKLPPHMKQAKKTLED